MKKSETSRAEQGPPTEQEMMELAELNPWSALMVTCVSKSRQREVYDMGMSFAQALKEDGALERSRDFLLLLLREKFKTIPESIVAEIQATMDIQQFDVWGIALLKARRITGMSFKCRPSPKKQTK